MLFFIVGRRRAMGLFIETLAKYNPYHDRLGRFTTEANAAPFSLPKDEKLRAKNKTKKRYSFALTKSIDDQMLAFGWANVAIRANGEQIEDFQGDIIDPEELEKAAYEFVELYREGGEMHERGGAAVLIESCVFTEEKMEKMGLPKGALPVGWWIGFKVLDPEVWAKIKDGTYTMFSIEGKAIREEVDED